MTKRKDAECKFYNDSFIRLSVYFYQFKKVIQYKKSSPELCMVDFTYILNEFDVLLSNQQMWVFTHIMTAFNWGDFDYVCLSYWKLSVN